MNKFGYAVTGFFVAVLIFGGGLFFLNGWAPHAANSSSSTNDTAEQSTPDQASNLPTSCNDARILQDARVFIATDSEEQDKPSKEELDSMAQMLDLTVTDEQTEDDNRFIRCEIFVHPTKALEKASPFLSLAETLITSAGGSLSLDMKLDVTIVNDRNANSFKIVEEAIDRNTLQRIRSMYFVALNSRKPETATANEEEPESSDMPLPHADGYECTQGSASFDCDSAQSNVEKAICASKELAERDCWLGYAYKGSLAKTNPTERTELRNEQRDWIRRREEMCGSVVGSEQENCIKSLTNERGQHLLETYHLEAEGSAVTSDDFQ